MMTKPGFVERRMAQVEFMISKEAERYANDWEETYPELVWDDMTPIEVSKIDFIAGAKWMMEQLNKQQNGSNE